MPSVDAAAVFAVSLLVGTIAILGGVRLLIDDDAGVANAALVSFLGAAIWAGSSFLGGPFPLLGLGLLFVTWVALINWRYPGGVSTAVGIGLLAGLLAAVLVYALSTVGLISPEALGLPDL